MTYNNFEDLPIWQNARAIVNQAYSIIENNPVYQTHHKSHSSGLKYYFPYFHLHPGA